MPALVNLTADEVAEANRLGDATWELFKGKPGYYGNRQASHRMGKLGEIAVEKWAMAQGFEVEPVFRDITQVTREDLVIGGIRVEVKTWEAKYWDDMGRCVRPMQLPALRRKTDIVIWCSRDGSEVTLHGWSTIADIVAQPVVMTGPTHKRLDNHQVPVDELRPLEAMASENRR
jgi:hypothetical protein